MRQSAHVPAKWGSPIKDMRQAAHVPAKWTRFAVKDMRQPANLRRFPSRSPQRAIHQDWEAL
jgi:hypothetical protein